MGATYLFDDRVRGAEDCKPVLAGLAGKAAGYCDEYPNRRINPETVKPLICARGGQVSARFGGAKEGQATSIEITATLIGAGNYPISVPPGTVGMADKIWDLTPEYIFVNKASINKSFFTKPPS